MDWLVLNQIHAMKRLLIAVLLFGTITAATAQVTYEPTPIVTLPPMTLPPSYVPPPSRYMVTPETGSKPAIRVLSKMLIKSVRQNGKDYTQHYVNGNAGIALYRYENDDLNSFMALVIPGDHSQSAGRMFSITNKETPQTSTTFGMTTTMFSWDFVDYPGGHKGTAYVTLFKEYRPDGTTFKCTIQFQGDVGVYEGIVFE